MPIRISGSTGVSGLDGTAATPSTQGANTSAGLFFPTINTVAIATNGTEAMRIDSNGSVGIGTSSPSSYVSPGQFVNYNSGSAALFAVGGTVSSYLFSSSSGGIGAVGTSSNHVFAFYTNGSERMRIDTSGRVGIGITPVQKLVVAGALQVAGPATLSSSTEPSIFSYEYPVTRIYVGDTTGYSLAFSSRTGGVTTDMLTIKDTSGIILINTSTALSSGQLQLYNSTNSTIYSQQIFNNYSGSGSTYFMEFLTRASGTNTQRGTILFNGTSFQYNTTSDARLKKDLGIVKDTSVIDNTIIHDFEWKENNAKGRGVFAQEAYGVIPAAVSEGGDELNDNGMPVSPWGVDYSKYVPDIIVYCQQLKATINELKAEFDAYKASHP